MNPSSNPPSGTSTPRAFTSQAASAEDLLKTQTVGLVNLAEFRKRRADALELKEKEIHDGGRSGTQTPNVEHGDGWVSLTSRRRAGLMYKAQCADASTGSASSEEEKEETC